MNSSAATLKLVVTPAQIGRTLARKGDMIAILALIVSSAAYSVYAVTQMTAF